MAKFEKGRKCLVLNSPLKMDLVGSEVFLGIPGTNPRDMEEKPILVRTWQTDPPIRSPCHENRVLVFPEAWLLPIDDETINEELRQEAVDDFGTKMVELDEALKKLDKALEDLSKSLEKQKQI